MKKIFIFLGLMFVMLSSTYAQKGRQAIGFGLSYGTEIESAGLGIKYQYNITNPLRIEPSFNYFFENDNVSMLDLNVNFHYLCPVAQSVKLYPLFGLTMSNWMFDMHDLDVDWDGDHVVSIRPRACFFPLFSFLPLWLHYNLNPLCVQY